MAEYSNYWQTTVQSDVSKPESELPESCDIVIIGGGFNGISTAFHLARAGANVVLIEEHAIGWGASGRNGGMALTGLKESASVLVQKYGMAAAKEYFQASLDAVELVRGLIKNEDLQVDIAETGHIEAASKTSHFKALIQEQKILKVSFDHHVDVFSANELKNEIKTEKYFGGLFDAKSLSLNPLQYITQLAAAAVRYGVKICENTPVFKIQSESDYHWITTSRGQIRCSRLVIATSAYSDFRLGKYQKTHLKIGSYVFVTQKLPFDGSELIKNDRSIYDSLNFLSYYRITADNRLLFGGRAVFSPENDANVRESERVLRGMMLDVFPMLELTRIDHVWGGTLDITLNKMPSFAVHRNLTFSVGFAGHGISMATYFGQQVARSILSDNERSIFQNDHINNVPFWHLRFVYLPFVEKYYRTLDNIN